MQLHRSLAESCDIYYYLLGRRLGVEGLAAWLQRFGLSVRTGLDPSFEATGLIGTPDTSRRVRKTPWYPGEAVSLSIGQGPMLATVAQLARAFAVLANGGLMVTPHLVSPEQNEISDLKIDPQHLAWVRDALEAVVHGPAGTARRLNAIPMAGKTGTAQVVRLQEGVSSDELAPKLRHHAWFVSWAPLEDPELVVSVIVEHGGDGGASAAPVAGHVITTFLAQSEGHPLAPPSSVDPPDAPGMTPAEIRDE